MKDAAIFLCDYTGIMAQPWAEAGYTCICVDVQHSIRAIRRIAVGQGEIFKVWGDARSWKPSDFDRQFHSKYRIGFVACFPVCTQLAASGARDWNKKGIPMLMDGLLLFNHCEQIADWSGAAYFLENPVGSIATHHRKPDYYFHPWYFGDVYTKYTCLWTGNGFVMPDAEYVTKPEGAKSKMHLMSPSIERQNMRSETPAGFARAVFESNGKAFSQAISA